MASKIVFVCITMAVFNMVHSQVIRNFGCGCGGGCGCPNILPIADQLINPYVAGPYLPPSPVVYDQPTTIIQDSTVANNLANALQLLVVSNLLSSTLPLDQPTPLAVPAANLAPLVPGLAPLEYLPSYVNAPVALSPFSSCGCGGCGCNSCGLSPFNVLY